MSFDAAFEFTATTAPTPVRLGGALVTRYFQSSSATIAPRRTAQCSRTFVRREFLAHFGARVRQFMPELLATAHLEGGVRAVVGCRAAATDRLFLETYTREPIESALGARNGILVPRENIVEIGSLACRNATAAIAIVRALDSVSARSRLYVGGIHGRRHHHERVPPFGSHAVRALPRRSVAARRCAARVGQLLRSQSVRHGGAYRGRRARSVRAAGEAAMTGASAPRRDVAAARARGCAASGHEHDRDPGCSC